MHRDGFASLLALVLLAVGATLVAGLLATSRSTTLHLRTAESRIIVDDLLSDDRGRRGRRARSRGLVGRQHADEAPSAD